MTAQLFALDPATYQSHALHGADRNWTETNCWLDMMIEVLHVLGCDPLAAASFTFETDFDGDQWTLFKFPLEDLRAVFGIEIAEKYVFRPVIDHLEEALSLGHLLTIEVDACYLPDTAGVTYHLDHVKTGIVAQMLDRDGKRLGYFHNAGYFEVTGEDFEQIFHLGGDRDPKILYPYVEVVKIDGVHYDEAHMMDTVYRLTKDHLAKRPSSNPMPRFEKRLVADLPWIAEKGDQIFHGYAFGSCRQCGASAELAASYVDWLADRDQSAKGSLRQVADAFRSIAQSAKALQFSLARVTRGRSVDLHGPLQEMERSWDVAMAGLVARYGG